MGQLLSMTIVPWKSSVWAWSNSSLMNRASRAPGPSSTTVVPPGISLPSRSRSCSAPRARRFRRTAVADREAGVDPAEFPFSGSQRPGHGRGRSHTRHADTVDLEADHSTPLLQFDNVIFTPHVAAYSQEASRDVGTGAVENVAAVLAGRWPPRDCVVNPDVIPRFELAGLLQDEVLLPNG